MSRVDFKEIRAQVSLEEVLARYGLQDTLKKRGSNYMGPCPIHKGTNPMQFSVSLEKNLFHCFSCKSGGNVIDFVAKMEGGVSVRQAALMLQEWFEIDDGEEKENSKKRLVTQDKPDKATVEGSHHSSARPNQETKRESGAGERKQNGEQVQEERVKEKNEERVNKPLSFSLQGLGPDHPYLAERGFTKETVIEFGAGYCKKGLMAGRIAIPLLNEKGELLAYAGRWPGEPPEGEGKYKLPAGFHKALVVFNLHRAKEYARDHGLILVEGFFDCMRLRQAGVKNVVALMGSSLSPEQEKLIVDAVGKSGKVALMFDEDEAGWKCREDVLTRLSTQVYAKVIGLGREGAQPDSLSDEEIQKLGLLDGK